MSQAIARIVPERIARPMAPPPGPREKAAIIVRLLLADGGALPLNNLPEHLQAALTEQMAAMALVDRATMEAVVGEFADRLAGVGLAFPGDIDGTLALLDGHISPAATSRLRRLAGASGKVDPWERIIPLPAERLLPLLEGEAVEIAAVLLSKLPVAAAAKLLERLPGERARRIAQAIARTADIDPDTVRRIGLALAAQLDAQPPRAFDDRPAQRVGAILNAVQPAFRDQLLDGLDDADGAFAADVRQAILTWEQIPDRLAPRDVPTIIGLLGQDEVLIALGGLAAGDTTAGFILGNLGQRMAQMLRDEIGARPPPPPRRRTAAQMALIGRIRQLVDDGGLQLRDPAAEE